MCGPVSVIVCTLCIQEPSETSDEDIGALRTAVECHELSDVQQVFLVTESLSQPIFFFILKSLY